MTTPRIRFESTATELLEGFARIRTGMGLPDAFPAEVMAEAAEVTRRTPQPGPDRVSRLDIDLLTIDPEGSRDLDQAFSGVKHSGGYRIHYAIADVGFFVDPGGALEREAEVRGRTLYSPDAKVPLYPPILSEGAGSLLPGELRPAILWTFELDQNGVTMSAGVERAIVRSNRQMTYQQAQEELDSGTAAPAVQTLRTVGTLRQRLEAERGGVDLGISQQEVHRTPEGFELFLRSTLMVERWNAQISLMTGMEAAGIMLAGGVGLLRTLPPPAEETIIVLRKAALGLGVPWPQDRTYQQVIRSINPENSHEAAVLPLATSLFRGVGYTFFNGARPENPFHYAIAAPYAHVTAPLRRMADRLSNDLLVELAAGRKPSEGLLKRLAAAPEIMKHSERAERGLESRIVDFVEAQLLQNRVGESFEAVVVQSGAKTGAVQLKDPAVLAPCTGANLPLGHQVTVVLTEADPVSGKVRFALK